MKEKIDIKEMINARKARGMILLEQGFEPKEVNKNRVALKDFKEDDINNVVSNIITS